jgi:hypothetical protein
VALTVAPELAKAALSLPESPAFWAALGQPREADAVASILRGLLPHAAHARLDPEAVVPLSHLVPWLPAHLQHVGVRVNDIEMAQLMTQDVPTAEHFAAREAANAAPVAAAAASMEDGKTTAAAAVAARSFVVEAKGWFADPKFHGMALLLRPLPRSPTPDFFFYVPVSAQRLLTNAPAGMVLTPLVFQVQIKGVVNALKAGPYTATDQAKEEAKALHGAPLAAFGNYFLVLVDNRLGLDLKPGLRQSSWPNMFSIVADPEDFLRVAPRRRNVDYSS